MKKGERMEEIIRAMAGHLPEGHPPEYTGFFVCFNRAEYYEAHDVLEHLWLRTGGPERDFYQGLILLAGAFVHLRKQYLRPLHFKDGRRLPAAARLLQLSKLRLADFSDHHRDLNLQVVRQLIEKTESTLRGSGFTKNPWRPETAPQLYLSTSD